MGRVRKMNTGRTIALTSPKRNAAPRSVHGLANPIEGSNAAATQSPRALINIRMMNPCIRHDLRSKHRRLEDTPAGLDEVATTCGFGSAETLRRAFHRNLRVAPSAYRARFESTSRSEPRH